MASLGHDDLIHWSLAPFFSYWVHVFMLTMMQFKFPIKLHRFFLTGDTAVILSVMKWYYDHWACHPDTYWWRRYTGNLSSSHWNSFEDGVLCKCDPHYLLSSGSRMASLNSMPSVMYLIRVSALVESSKRTQWPTWWKSRQMVFWLLYRNYFSYLFFNKTFSIFIFLLRTCTVLSLI